MRKLFILFISFFACAFSFGQMTYDNLNVDYDSAWQFKNLKIIPIRWKGPGNFGDTMIRNTVSLRQALEKGMARISERGTASTENVHWLTLENLSSKNIFITSGEIMSGGRQDRMVSRDTLMRSNQKKMQLPVMCVEEERWSEKTRKFVYGNQIDVHIRKILDRSKNQVMLWRAIYDELHANNIRSSSIAYLSITADKKYSKSESEYLQYFLKKFKASDSTITGIVCVSGDKVIGCDIYIATNLFYDELTSLLYSYIHEAILYGSLPVLPDTKVEQYMDKLLTDEASQEAFIKENGKAYWYGGRLIHITTY